MKPWSFSVADNAPAVSTRRVGDERLVDQVKAVAFGQVLADDAQFEPGLAAGERPDVDGEDLVSKRASPRSARCSGAQMNAALSAAMWSALRLVAASIIFDERSIATIIFGERSIATILPESSFSPMSERDRYAVPAADLQDPSEGSTASGRPPTRSAPTPWTGSPGE